MEEIIWRFPLVGSQIFGELDDFSLAKCRETCILWRDFINNQRFYKNRIQQMMTDKVKEKGRIRGELSQIHAAAMCGQARLLIELMEQEVVKNSPNDRRVTPLHLAAEHGFLSICKYIIDRTDDKNPSDEIGRTPLHFAALNGHIKICELIINNADVKNPREERFGKTPLHNAATNGHVEICKLITENVVEKNPKDKSGSTPFHSAASMGKSEVFIVLMEKVGDEYVDQPEQCMRRTPLQIAEAMFPPDVMKEVKNRYFTLKRARILRNYKPKRWKRNQSAVKALRAFRRVYKKYPRKVEKSAKINVEDTE